MADKTVRDKAGVIKLSFNVSKEQFEALKRMASSRNQSMTEVLRHAIALEEYVEQEMLKGNRIIVQDHEGRNREIIVLIR